MKCYGYGVRVEEQVGDGTAEYVDVRAYVGTLAEAHEGMKSLCADGGFDWRDVGTEEFEVPTDKAGVLAIMNNTAGYDRTGRSWELTPRKGLKEVTGEQAGGSDDAG